MTDVERYARRMGIFVVAALGLAVLLAGELFSAFVSNAYLNGTILAVLVFGIVFQFRQVLALAPELRWLDSDARRREEEGATPQPKPRLLAAVAQLIADHPPGRGPMPITAATERSLIEGVESRLDEGREIGRYLTRLLVFLGLLGTFWGLLSVLAAIGQTISGLSVETSDVGLLFESLKAGLERPLGGMAVAFSSSLFGLGGSLVLGFLDLQTSQAQRAFLRRFEDWLRTHTRLVAGAGTAGEEGAAGGSAYLAALIEQLADHLERMEAHAAEDRRLRESREKMLAELRDHLAALHAEAEAGREALHAIRDVTVSELRTLAGLAEGLAARKPATDPELKAQLARIEQALGDLAADIRSGREALADSLRDDLRLLARTVAKALEAARRPGGADDGAGGPQP
ncbi:MAG: flagellar motor protein MotA [Rhodothalassiaceae bacterium]|nr:MAG: flagellar motor protein MotA [Rhodothalassiaceae bacterium]